MAEDIKAFQINIQEVIRTKNPKLAKRLPKFIIRWIEKILHQREMNETLENHKEKFGFDFTQAVLDDFQITLKFEGDENIPKEGRFIFAANHPLGALESMVMMIGVGKHFKEVRFLVNDLLLHLKNFHPLFVPINKHGAQSREATAQIDEVYNSDAQILYFPSGMVSRKIKGRIQDTEWKKSFIVKSKKHERDIIPVFLVGRNSNFFYNFANFRKRIGIKANIEMFFLPNEMYKQKGKTITVIFGKPIPHSTFDSSKSLPEWAKYVRDIVYSMNPNKI